MDRFFKISERGSSVGSEFVGGLTTFLAMAYIIAVNPIYLLEAGVPPIAALTATCFGAALMTLIMGLVANRPIALASGMGINAIVAFTLCSTTGYGVDWRVAMSVVFLEGVIILVLVLCGLRKAIMDAIPVDLRRAIGIGIGLFIAFIGLKGAGIISFPGFIVTDPATGAASIDVGTLLNLGNLGSAPCIVALISIACAVILHALKVPGDLLISIVIATIIGIPMGVTPVPVSLAPTLPDFSAFFAPFQTDPVSGNMAVVQVFFQPALLLMVFSLLMSDFFDTMGTIVAVGQQGDFVDKEGNVADVQPILAVDSVAAIAGGLFGASSITTYVESTSGAAAGARTGLSNVFVAILFAVFVFFSPIVGMVTSASTCGALVVVGYLMMSDIGEIDWKKIEYAFPAFVTIFMIPFTYSITNGIGMGFISFVVVMICRGRIKEIKPLMWVAAIAFLLMFIFT